MPVGRIEIRRKPGQIDPRADDLVRNARSFLNLTVHSLRTADLYLIEGDLNSQQLEKLATNLLADPVTNTFNILQSNPAERQSTQDSNGITSQIVEVHPLPGVMDPTAQSVENAIHTLLGRNTSVRTGIRYEFENLDPQSLEQITRRLLANPIVQAVHRNTYHPTEFPRGRDYQFSITTVSIRNLDDKALNRMSRDAHLFLSLDEMQCLRDHFRAIDREPTDIELETIAQTWSEHCVHKTLKSTIRFRGSIPHAESRPGHQVNPVDGSITIHNLLKSTIAAATFELREDGLDEWLLSVFVDNAGIIKFDEDTAVCFKVETHNHPSALEPYGGAATGIGGCIRDVIGTGLAAKPIAATDIFCVAHPNLENIPAGCLHPRRILSQIVAGVRDYGNRMGIPTVNGAVSFDNRYVGNPLVYCGCIGEMPIDKITGDAQQNDHIIVIGGRTGRDGIHGATFSSAELTDSHADEFSHAVQIGNAITQKKTLDTILRLRDHQDGCLFNAITDCGAGGFSSAVGEMGEQIGATVHLDHAPLKYDGLSYTEIWISEAQERMVLAVPEENIEKIARICDAENIEYCDLGTFGTPNRELILNYQNTEVGHLSMEFLHNGLPTPTREATWNPPNTSTSHPIPPEESPATLLPSIESTLLNLLAHPDIASKHWIIRQYDHEVQGRTVIKPLAGRRRLGPMDASVILPKRNSNRALAIANGLATAFADDPYAMTTAAIDECVRNLVCVGTNPSRIAILDNFCWPSCNKPENLGSLVLAAEACYDAAKAFRIPFISGKDSLNNQFTTEDGKTIEIPPTLLISGFGIVNNINHCITMDAKSPGNFLLIVGITTPELGGAHVLQFIDHQSTASANNNPDEFDLSIPQTDLTLAPKLARAVAELIENNLVQSAHDCSEGGILVAAAEMAFSGNLGLDLHNLENLPVAAIDDDNSFSYAQPDNLFNKAFAESPSRYLLEIKPEHLDVINQKLANLPHAVLGSFNPSPNLTAPTLENLILPLQKLINTWRAPLDW